LGYSNRTIPAISKPLPWHDYFLYSPVGLGTASRRGAQFHEGVEKLTAFQKAARALDGPGRSGFSNINKARLSGSRMVSSGGPKARIEALMRIELASSEHSVSSLRQANTMDLAGRVGAKKAARISPRIHRYEIREAAKGAALLLVA